MERNSMAFTPVETKQGMVMDLLSYLLGFNAKSEDHYCDVHVTSDGYCTIVEWAVVPCDGSYGGKFEYVDEDQYVTNEVRFPDGHYEYVPSKEEGDEMVAEWVKANPGWRKNQNGVWTNDEENERIRKETEEDAKTK